MKVSVIIPARNEEKTIASLLKSLLNQTRPPDEIIVVNAGSTDRTAKEVKAFQQLGHHIRLLSIPPAYAGRARNVAIENASCDIIASIDAGCVADENWLQNIIKPFEEDADTDVVGGFFLPPKDLNFFETCASIILYDTIADINPETFSPGGASIAFKKNAWLCSGKFPEQLRTCQDNVFVANLRKIGCRFAFAKDAAVYWRPRSSIRQIFKQYFLYSRGEAQIALERFGPIKIYIPYILGLGMLFLGFWKSIFWLASVFGFLAYIIFYRIRHIGKLKNKKLLNIRLPYVILSIVLARDLGRMFGYPVGLFERLRNPGLFDFRKKGEAKIIKNKTSDDED